MREKRNIFLTPHFQNLNARSRFFKFTPCKIKIYDRKEGASGDGNLCGGEEEITYVTLSEGIVRNKNIYQPAVHEKGWSEEKLIKYVI